MVAWIPDAGVLFGGDAVRSRSLGYTEEADLQAWPATITALKDAYGDARILVPGHGAPGGPELLDGTLALLEDASR